ncbi:MAG TPA: hypothetical protein PLM24_10600, partial [Methanothrix sp.]|nr:hypothetical protein [Methanothrix sp.]HPJ84355.1 hypothetical protein [Methanothrix sp.]HPR67570.1 hypothetical protein [Methanothrix sp.]
MIKPITGLFLVFWGLVKVYQGWLIYDGGVDFGAAVIVFGLLAALVGGLFLRDSLRWDACL